MSNDSGQACQHCYIKIYWCAGVWRGVKDNHQVICTEPDVPHAPMPEIALAQG